MVRYAARILNLIFSPGGFRRNVNKSWHWQISWGQTKTNSI